MLQFVSFQGTISSNSLLYGDQHTWPHSPSSLKAWFQHILMAAEQTAELFCLSQSCIPFQADNRGENKMSEIDNYFSQQVLFVSKMKSKTNLWTLNIRDPEIMQWWKIKLVSQQRGNSFHHWWQVSRRSTRWLFISALSYINVLSS